MSDRDMSVALGALPTSPDELRVTTRKLYRAAGMSLVGLAAALARIEREQLWRQWGHESWFLYMVHELQIQPRLGYQLVDVYRRWESVWPEILSDPPPWNHLVEACPLLAAEVEQPGPLLAQIRNGATVQRIRRWKDERLPLRRVSAVPPEFEQVAERITTGGAPVRDASRDCGPSKYLVMDPDLELVSRWVGTDGRPWVAVRIALPEPVLELFTRAIAGVARALGLPPAAADTRARLAAVVEAMSQECLASWPAPDPDSAPDQPPRS